MPRTLSAQVTRRHHGQARLLEGSISTRLRRRRLGLPHSLRRRYSSAFTHGQRRRSGRQLHCRGISPSRTESQRGRDTAVVYRLEDSVDSGSPAATAHKLEQLYANQKDADSWKPGGADDIAWESNQLARSGIYQALNIPVESCQPYIDSCAPRTRTNSRPGQHLHEQSGHACRPATSQSRIQVGKSAERYRAK